jgi:tetratricopeptide (TPR) repeat protein
MTNSEAKDLVSRKLHIEETDAAALSSLLDRLENLPLAITQAIAFISEYGIDVAKYLDLLTKSEAETIKLLSTNLEDGRRYSQIPHSVVNTWRLSFDLIKEREPLASELLSVMSFLDRQSIPRQLLLGEEDDGVDFTKALAPLKAFRFIMTDKSGQGFAMHGLVQLSTKVWLAAHGETKVYEERALATVSKSFPLGEHKNWVFCQQLLPHAEAVLTYRLDDGSSSAYRTKLLTNLSWFYSKRGQYKSAFTLRKEIYDKAVEDKGQEHPDTLLTMGNLARTYAYLGEMQEAKKLEVQVLELRKRILGGEHPGTLLTMGNLAATYADLGEMQEAKKLGVQVLELKKRILGEEHPETLLAIGNLARTYADLGELQEAKKLEVQVLELKKRILGEEHPHTLLTMGNLAATYSNLGEMQEAKKLEVQVLELKKRILGEEHPGTQQ